MHYKLEKPEKTIDGRKIFFEKIMTNSHLFDAFQDLLISVSGEEYLYWDKIKYKQLPEGLTKEEAWSAIKFVRSLKSEETPIRDFASNKNFRWYKPDYLDKLLHELDMDMGGSLHVGTSEIDIKQRNSFISRGVMEEAIASSQLEGAHTTRKAAKKMILENRKPHNESERMILNNYKTMLLIESEYKNKKLNVDLLLELHTKVTESTMDTIETGRFRENSDDLVVQDKIKGVIYHVPPSNEFLKKEILRFVDFANDVDENNFIHPVVKAILIHFWFAYLHPFTDGNGRMSRLLFYWYLLKKGYWAFSYLPISSVIKKSPEQYGMAYVYSEQDDLDVTYFLNYTLKKIKMAIADFKKYVELKKEENKIMSNLAHNAYGFNLRQIQVLQFLYENPTEFTTMTIHMNSQQISKKTAIGDLKELLKEGFLTEKPQGRYSYYFATTKLHKLFSGI
ncbi:MAG: Fic family protein [Candidatus Pacebacteria bacterium]|nr:Fic family protein [Candidatus Paceibacterota bacterium]MBP9818359.1 Fic family protein [Candidatus Paceibacterota bacterium]